MKTPHRKYNHGVLTAHGSSKETVPVQNSHIRVPSKTESIDSTESINQSQSISSEREGEREGGRDCFIIGIG